MSTSKSLTAFFKAEENGTIKLFKHRVLKIFKDHPEGLTIRQACDLYSSQYSNDARDKSATIVQLYRDGLLSITNENVDTDDSSIYKFEQLSIDAMNNRRIQIATKKVKSLFSGKRAIAKLVAEIIHTNGQVPDDIMKHASQVDVVTYLEKLRK